MYPVSDLYKNTIASGAMEFDVYGTIGSENITAGNIMSLSITNQCSSESEVRIGQVYVGQLNMTVVGTNLVPRTLAGKAITLYAGPITSVPSGILTDGNGNVLSNESGAILSTGMTRVAEYLPLGIFYVDSAMWTQVGIEIVAYDAMAKFDVNVPSFPSGTPFSILSAACTACGVPLGMTQAQIEALPNGTFSATCFEPNDITTYRDVISWIAQMMGCYSTIDRSGQLVLRTYKNTADEAIDSTRRYMGGSFSDYVTYYSAMVLTNITTNEDTRRAIATDDGLTYTLGSNPFLQTFADDTEKEAVLGNLLAAITAFRYVPFMTEIAPDPRYDLGDVIAFTGGIADGTEKYCITKFEWTYNKNNALVGVGRNAAYKDQITSPVKAITLVQNTAVVANQAAETAQTTAEDAQTAAEDAAKTATDYIEDVTVGDNDGIEITGNGASSKVQITDTVKVIADATHYAEMTDSQFKIHAGNATNPAAYLGALDAGIAGDGSGNYLVKIYARNMGGQYVGGAIDLQNIDGNTRVRIDAMDKYGTQYFFNDDGYPMVEIGAETDGSYGLLKLYQETTAITQGYYLGVELGKVTVPTFINTGAPALLIYENPTQTTDGYTRTLTAAYGGGAAYIRASSSFAGYVAHGKTISHRLTFDFDTISNYNYLRFWIDGTEVARLQQQSFSDERVKTDIEPIRNAYKEAVAAVDIDQFRYDFNDPVRQGGNGLMFGIIAQDLIKALDDRGIDFNRTPLVSNIDNDDESLYSVDYTSFLLARLAAAEDRIATLEGAIS